MNVNALRLPALLAAVFLLAAGPAGTELSGSGWNGYQLETDETLMNFKTGDFTMPHEVRVTRPGTDARGDHAKGNNKIGTATLIGHVVVHDSGSAPEASDAGPDYQGPATITCDELTIDTKTKSYDGHGNLRFVQGNRVGTADRGVLNQTAHTLHLEGNVVLAEGATSMKANVVDYNLQTRDVIASGGPMTIREPIPERSSGPPPSPKPKK
jgi:lipopolysaccharide export system protein LptA